VTPTDPDPDPSAPAHRVDTGEGRDGDATAYSTDSTELRRLRSLLG